VHLVGVIIRIYHDARSPERQTAAVPAVTLILKEYVYSRCNLVLQRM